MKQLRPFLFAVLLVVSFTANAKSDYYYSQGLDIDFALADENKTIKMTLEGLINRLFKFINPAEDDSVAINFDYYTDMERELDE